MFQAWVVIVACFAWAFLRFLVTKPWSD